MAKKKKEHALDDDGILSIVTRHVNDGVGYHDSELSKERADVQRYYDAVLPKPSHKGNSKFVSQDVYDSVEAMKATLQETFSSGAGLGSFDPQNAGDVKACEVATSYTDYVIYRQNDAYGIFGDVIYDGLMARIGVAKVYWHKCVDAEEEEFKDANQTEVMLQLGSDPDLELKEYAINADGTMSGTFVRNVDRSQVVIEPIAPEEFLVGSRAKSIKHAPCTHRTKKTRSDLRKMGYDKKKVEELADDAEAWESDEDLVRFDGTENVSRPTDEDSDQEAKEKCWLNETYIDLDIDGEGTTRLFKVCWAGHVLLDKEQVSEKPFCIFTPLRRPHALMGSNYAKKVIPTQNAKTVLTRGILDHTVITNNPRYKVVNGALPRPDELLDNRFGGIVNVKRPDGVLPLEQAPLNPFVFQSLQLLDYELEDTTGVSKLSQGMNKDAVSKQNSQALIEQLTTASMQRQKIIARNFAEQFLKPLYEMVYRIVLENEDRKRIFPVAGKWVEVDVTSWVAKRTYSVSLHLGYGEQDRKGTELVGIASVLKETPLFPVEKQYNVAKKLLEFKGYKDVDNFIITPDKVEPPQPPPEIMVKLKELELDKERLALDVKKAQMAHAETMEKLAIERLRVQGSHAIAADRVDLDEKAEEHKQMIAEQEQALAEKTAARVKDPKITAIASPNS